MTIFKDAAYFDRVWDVIEGITEKIEISAPGYIREAAELTSSAVDWAMEMTSQEIGDVIKLFAASYIAVGPDIMQKENAVIALMNLAYGLGKNRREDNEKCNGNHLVGWLTHEEELVYTAGLKGLNPNKSVYFFDYCPKCGKHLAKQEWIR